MAQRFRDWEVVEHHRVLSGSDDRLLAYIGAHARAGYEEQVRERYQRLDPSLRRKRALWSERDLRQMTRECGAGDVVYNLA